ncbi:hypothetical protein EZJ19_06365 [Parasulfuritortus cantonensis]|uniref:Uncharacterized protein n=1 Tax=Parasulfuritortus cantonensis TaxID=2528202 RepID=A0A4R1BF82_9PROT|nr:hypothetical protein EZJ19_06365 [Parasulfuritortus cantonensis]
MAFHAPLQAEVARPDAAPQGVVALMLQQVGMVADHEILIPDAVLGLRLRDHRLRFIDACRRHRGVRHEQRGNPEQGGEAEPSAQSRHAFHA